MEMTLSTAVIVHLETYESDRSVLVAACKILAFMHIFVAPRLFVIMLFPDVLYCRYFDDTTYVLRQIGHATKGQLKHT